MATMSAHGAATRGHGSPVASGGHDKHAGHSVAMFRDKFWLSLLLTIPVVAAEPRRRRSGSATTLPTFPGSSTCRRSSARSSSSTAAWSSSAAPRASSRDRQPGMMTLISLAIVVAFVTSWAGDARPVRGRDLVGARHPHHDHAARPLARDALDRPGARRARRARRAAAGHGRAGHRRRHRDGRRSRRSRSATSSSSGPAPASRPTATSSRARPTSTSR